MEQEVAVALACSSALVLYCPTSAALQTLRHFTFLRGLIQQEPRLKELLSLQLVVAWVDDSHAHVDASTKKAQQLTTAFLAAETGFSEQIGERCVMAFAHP
jgi:hypothetical protein